MTTLHIFNQSPTTHNNLHRALTLLDPSSAIVLIEDAVLAGIKPTIDQLNLRPWLSNKQLFALLPDVLARGLTEKQLSPIQLIDYNGFVDLVAKYSKSISW